MKRILNRIYICFSWLIIPCCWFIQIHPRKWRGDEHVKNKNIYLKCFPTLELQSNVLCKVKQQEMSLSVLISTSALLAFHLPFMKLKTHTSNFKEKEFHVLIMWTVKNSPEFERLWKIHWSEQRWANRSPQANPSSSFYVFYLFKFIFNWLMMALQYWFNLSYVSMN